MKRVSPVLVLLFLVPFINFAQDAKTISDCTVVYDLTVDDPKADPSIVKVLSQASKVLYIKGSKTRSDLETTTFKQIMIYDSKTDSSVILRELGNSKYISYLDGNKRKDKYSKYAGIKFTETNERKTILGYECKKVIANLTDGSNYNVFYTTSIVPTSTDYEYQFRDLPGFVLEYEAVFERGNIKVRYTASKITLVPVPVAKFDVPKSGYRVL